MQYERHIVYAADGRVRILLNEAWSRHAHLLIYIRAGYRKPQDVVCRYNPKGISLPLSSSENMIGKEQVGLA